MSWRKAVINNAFYVFPPTEVKTFPQVELNRHIYLWKLYLEAVVSTSIRQTQIFQIDVWKRPENHIFL